MAAIARNNAFGPGAPSWNLSFPAGELTAAEIIAYCPHWLKSIDVVNRFLCHGARTIHITALLNEFRAFPDDRIFNTNSTLVMMSYAMRKAGFDGWCVMTHFDYPRHYFLPESGLSVTHFRTPCMTHPKDVTSEDSHRAINQEVRPVPFKDLAKHVKKHPSGDDALDLARCVQYAIKHPDEVWLFPTDFQRLTAHLGGPETITPAHLDQQVFARRDHVKIPIAKRKRPAAIKPNSTNKQPTNKQPTGARRFINIMSQPGPSQPRKRVNDHLSTKDTNSAEECEAGHEENELFGQPAKKPKLSHGRETYNSYTDDDEFIPGGTETNEYVPERDFGGPEQDEQPHSEADRSMALRKTRDGKRAAVGPDTAAPQLNVGHNYGSRQPDLLDNSEGDFNFAPNYSRQFGVASSYAQKSNVASGYSQKSSLPNVYSQQSGPAPTHGQQTSLTPAYGQKSGLSSGYGQQSSFPSDYGPQSSFAPSNGQTSDFSSVFDQNFDFTSSFDQQLDSTSSFSRHSSFASKFDIPQCDFPLSSGSQRPSVASSYDQPPFSFVSDENQLPFGLAPTFDQIPLSFEPTLDQKPSDFDSSPATQQIESPNTTTANPRGPAPLTPLILPSNRLRITSQNLHHYALPPFLSQGDMYTTAFDYMRFGGARKSAPYRELHNLCCLNKNDTGDWAENIRFAKEQWLYYGAIWTEFKDHLERITRARLEKGWRSAEAIRADARMGFRAM